MSRTHTSPGYFVDDPNDFHQPEYEAFERSYAAHDYLTVVGFGAASEHLHGVFTSASHEPAARSATRVVQNRYTLRDDAAWAIVHWHPRFATTETYTAGLWSGRRLAQANYADALGDVRDEFNAYRDEWRRQSEYMSSVTEMILLPAYQRIIGLGKPAVPLIVDELREGVDHWFWALSAITGTDHAAGATTMSEAAARWIAWYDSQT
ncbi:hypothetical protein [Rhodococcus sp. 05-2255-1e]|uniref:hypothetical protein n=1 Tax=Rhodococcus sp. 05-2255-1e TaxID=2022495 RepID=UPI00117A279F|nr:hypothetical protein [Rhodococcus sp. 05-2255-1e]